ncbi:hypothetical protein T265_14516, partial [Opisthorchis viverrini]
MVSPLRARQPAKWEVASTNQKLESYYNRKHGAKWRHSDIEKSVSVKDYHGNRVSWSQGEITRRIGNVIYDVEVAWQTWVRQANQLKQAYSRPADRVNVLYLK